jgi:hypothetical protein
MAKAASSGAVPKKIEPFPGLRNRPLNSDRENSREFLAGARAKNPLKAFVSR